MILALFLLLLGITFLIFVLGFWADNPVLSITGGGFLFITGYVLMIEGIEFAVGNTIVTAGATTTVTPIYTTLVHHTIGFFLTFIGFIAIFLTLMNMWKARGGKQ